MYKLVAILVLFLSFMSISYADELKLKGADNDLVVILDNSPTVANFVKSYSQSVKTQFGLPTKKIGKFVIADLLKYTKIEESKLLITAPVLGPGFDLLVKYYDLKGNKATLTIEKTVEFGQNATFSLSNHKVLYTIDGATLILDK